jgi:hypothetical protein
VAACVSYLPPGLGQDVAGAFGRLLEAFDEAHGIRDEVPEPASTTPGDGRFAVIAFMGHNEYTGYVTEIVKHGQPAYRVDLPGKLWGGNPDAYVEYAASAWFSEMPRSEEAVRRAWESQVRAAAERKRREDEWDRLRQQRALEAGGSEDGEDLDDEDEVYERDDSF